MRLITYKNSAYGTSVGVVNPEHHEQFVDVAALLGLAEVDMTRLLASSQLLGQLRSTVNNGVAGSDWLSLANHELMVPIIRPGKIVCMGLNYAEHAKEGGNARPDYPSFFMRGATSLLAHGKDMIRPRVSAKLDYEAELTVIIGKTARHLTEANALDCVAGYSCFNDGSIRDYQRKSAQWTIGKNFDATGGFGPWIVTPDELPEGCAGLRIQSRLNGNVMQDANTADFLWNVKEALVLISGCMTLEPGDVIITGTPAGVGYARNPPVWMQPGDTIEVEIEGIGTLRHGIADEA